MEDYNTDVSRGSRKMATAALILAFLSVPLFFLFYVSIPLAATALLLALLSRGKAAVSFRGKMAIFIAAVSIGLSASITISAAVALYRSPELRHQLEQIMDYYDSFYEEDSQSISDLLEDYLTEPGGSNEENSVPQWNMEGGTQI